DSSTKLKLLEVLVSIGQKFKYFLRPYSVELQKICLLLFNQDKTAAVKALSLDLLTLMAEATSGHYQTSSQMDIPKLTEKFLEELAKSAKGSVTVRAKIFKLFGTFFECYPDLLSKYARKLFDIYLRTMTVEFKSMNKPELLIIAACLEGCNKLLQKHQPYDPEDDETKYYDLFQCARKAIEPVHEIARYDMPKAGLSLFEKNSGFFIKFLQDVYLEMYNLFWSLFDHHNKELANFGQRALEAFIFQISRAIVEEDSDALHKTMFKENNEKGTGVYRFCPVLPHARILSRVIDNNEGAVETPEVAKFFLEKSSTIIKDNNSKKKEIEVAIKCFGLLAGPCKKFHSQDDVNFMFVEILGHSKHLLDGNFENFHDSLYSVTSFLEALSSILKEVNDISDESLKSVENLLIAMIENIPHVYVKYHFKCVRAILKVFLALMTKETHLRQILKETVYQCLVRMSHLPVPLQEARPAGASNDSLWGIKKQISYQDYISLWSDLLRSSSHKELSTIGYSFSDRNKLTQLLYDEVLSSVVRIIESLDLTVSTNTSENTDVAASFSENLPTASADPTHDFQLNCIHDHQVFYNIVNFCCEFLDKNEKKMFEKWLFKFCYFLVKISTSTPLVSDFYKLLTICMKMAKSLKYFKGISNESTKIKENSSQTNAEKIACFLLMKKFSKEVLVQLKQYKAELLATCLALVLSLPVELIADEITDFLPAVQLSLSFGLNYLGLCNAAIDSLEYWTKSLPQDSLKIIYSQVLPYFDPYIRTLDKGSDDVDLSSIETDQKKYILDAESELSKVKRRIAKFLGTIGGCFNLDLLANTDADVLKYAVAWDTRKHLKFDLPFNDMRPSIYLDPFLPPILELAMKSSDRQTKSSACEFLHSAVLYSLGLSVQCGSSNRGEDRFTFEKIYQNIFPVLLQLACDMDQVPKQLFEPLVFQLIHWFTSNQKFENAESMSLLDAIYDGIIQSKDTSLRDFCAKCIAEFFKWSLKRKSTEKNPVNVTSIFTRLKSYSLHPDPFKRLGAALAFNNIYVIFREHDNLVDEFVFDILEHFVKSLSLCHTDDSSLGVHTQYCKAIDHIERIIIRKADMLGKESENRKHPRQWNQITIPYAVRWLVRQCGCPQISCRHACMKLVYNLAPHIQGIEEPKDYFQIFYEKQGQQYFINRFEGGGQEGATLQSILVTLQFSLQKARQWFDYLLASLDCYNWVFEAGLLTPEQIFIETADTNACPSQVFPVICYFLENIALSDMKTLAEKFISDDVLFTPKEEEKFSQNKCTVIIRIFNFLATVLMKSKLTESPCVIPEKIWADSLWNLIWECVLQPDEVGFKLSDLEVANKLPETMEKLLKVFLKQLPAVYGQKLRDSAKLQLIGNRNLLEVLPILLECPNINYFKLQQLLSGYSILNKVKLLEDLDLKCLAEKLLENVCKNIAISSNKNRLNFRTLTPTETTLTQTLLQLAIQLSLPVNTFMTVMFPGNLGPKRALCGNILLCVFKQEVSGYIIEHASLLIPLIMEKSSTNPQLVGHMLIAVLNSLNDKRSKWKGASQICGIILENWSKLEYSWKNDVSEDIQRVAFDILIQVLRMDSKILSDSQNSTCKLLHEFFHTILSYDTISPSFKVSLLDMVPFLALSPDPLSSQLRTKLKIFFKDKSQPRTLLYDTYISFLDKILFALKKTKSETLLMVVIDIFCTDDKEAHSGLESFIKQVSSNDQKRFAQIPFDIFRDTTRHSNNFRRLVIKKICLPFLRNLSRISFVEFLKSNITVIMKIIAAEMPKTDIELHLINKICCFDILQVTYTHLEKKDVHGESSEINSVYCQTQGIAAEKVVGNELTKTITSISHNTKSEDMTGETQYLDHRRQLHCSAYNVLLAVISCTQTKLKFYTTFLFAETEEKMLPKKQRVLQGLRSKVQQQTVSEIKQTTKPYHLSSMYLQSSSLAADLGQHDYLSSNSPSYTEENVETTSVAGNEDSGEYTVKSKDDAMNYTLEMDEINHHECMLSLVAAVKHMYHHDITPKEDKEMAPWMCYLHKRFSTPSTHLNIKLFIAKLIVNTAEVFEKYASHWVLPLSQFIISQEIQEYGINYFVVDIIVTIVSWGDYSVPEDTFKYRTVASGLVEFLIRNINDQNQRIFRHNINLLEALIGHWKAKIDVPYRLLFEMMTSNNHRMICVQLLGAILACNLPPYVYTKDIPPDQYFEELSKGFQSDSKRVYAATSEVLGLSLKYYDLHKDNESQNIMNIIECIIEKKLNHRGENAQRMLQCFIVSLHKMQTHYKPVAKRYLQKLLYYLPKIYGDFRLYCLEMLLGNITNIDSAFTELKGIKFLTFFANRNEKIRLTCLLIVKALLAKLKPGELVEIITTLDTRREETCIACRKVLYDILMWIYDNYGEDESNESYRIMSYTQLLLLKGLEDKDYSCRVYVQNFWSNRTQLPESTFDRMATMLNKMYSPRTEQQFLYYASNLLLEMTSKSPEYNQQIFRYPLEDCKFQEYKIESSWQNRHSRMTPLFFSALSSSYTQEVSNTESMKDPVELRDTYGEQQQFTPTQDVPFNWLTQSNQPFTMEVDTLDSGAPSSLLTASRSTVTQIPSPRKRPGPEQKQASTSVSSLSEKSQSVETRRKKFEYLRKRVLKDSSSQGVYYAKLEIVKKATRVQYAFNEKSRHENQVTLYRKYRSGDLPDIQITYSYLIATLQAVAQRDSSIARLLFNSLFNGIYGCAEGLKAEEDMKASNLAIQSSIEIMLKSSELYFPPFISCMLNILYDMDQELSSDIKQLIATSAITAQLQPLAITVLEEQLIKNQFSCQPSRTKKKRPNVSNQPVDISTWLELAKLYKSINEYDSVLGIFKDHVGCQEASKMAIKAEIRGDYSEAMKHYVTALNSTESRSHFNELDTWNYCYVQCLENLSRWDKVEKECIQRIDPENNDFSKVWEDSSIQETYLPPLIQSKLKLLQQNNLQQNEFLQFIDDVLSSSFTDRTNILEHQFSKELSQLFLYKHNYHRALIYINNAIQKFLQEWCNTDILMKSRRKYLLQNLQTLSETENFLLFIENEDNIKSCCSINNLLSCWEKHTPSLLEDPVKVWDDVITNRLQYIDHISFKRSKPEFSNVMDTSEDSYLPKQYKLTLQLLRANSCCVQNNFKLAQTILKDISGDCKHAPEVKLQVMWTHLYVQCGHKHHRSFIETCTKLVKDLNILCEHNLSVLPEKEQDLRSRHNVLYGKLVSTLASVLIKEENWSQFEDLPPNIKQNIAFYAGHGNDDIGQLSTQELSEKLIISGCEYLKKNVLCENHEKSDSIRENFGQTHLAIAKYCDQFLQRLPFLAETLMSSSLKAIQYGLKEAQQRFCHLLRLLETHPHTIDIFINQSRAIPCWMFLMWINQMMSLLDKPEAYAIQDIVYDIACQFPQAVIYSFRISKEGFKFEDKEVGRRNKQFFDKLTNKLNSKALPLVFTFISSLESFAHPLNVFKDWYSTSANLLQKSKPDKEKIIVLYKEMYLTLFERNCEDNTSHYYQQFKKKFHSSFVKAFGENGSKINGMKKQDFGGICSEVMNQKIIDPVNLVEFSSWMSNFDPLLDTLEIPGQYHGFKKPLPEYHIKVSGFDEKVMTFASKQVPRKIIIRGNDHREYPFIVKCGEDLRQDQRIQQLSGVINEILKKDPICQTKRLQLKTYQIIPMTTSVGLLECLQNVSTLENTLKKDSKCKQYINNTYVKHRDFRSKFSSRSCPMNMFKKCSKSAAESEYHAICALIPWNLLRQSFKRMSTSPEAFHVLRTGFTISHAVLCICHYILGVGDRHLSNLMVHQGTGQMVGIDFGYAFGLATQYLPIPELIPFRLTRQLQNVSLPHGTKGIFEGTMMHCLKAIRSDKDLLIHTMEIFIREPSVDWLKNAQKSLEKNTAEEFRKEDLSWYPRQKIDFVRRKLDGEHPAYIMRDEVALNSYAQNALEAVSSVILGTEDNIRSTLPQKDLTIEQQVTAAIDLATDPNILIRIFEGWKPFV
ncbi:DNA-dependent protein kinase catalytic subunit-like isoform X1, partial [Argonauta hians]